jgi:hypothetical protein
MGDGFHELLRQTETASPLKPVHLYEYLGESAVLGAHIRTQAGGETRLTPKTPGGEVSPLKNNGRPG